jgi:hypothetical protein
MLVGMTGVVVLLPACAVDTNARTTIGAERTLPALTFGEPADGEAGAPLPRGAVLIIEQEDGSTARFSRTPERVEGPGGIPDGSRPAAVSVESPPDPPTTRLDRSGWRTIDYRLPVDGTAHAPIWRTRASLGDSPPRQHGLYPTPESVLDLGADTRDHLALGLTQPVIALADVFLLPVRMIAEPVWSVRQSPSMYKRWRSAEWLVGPTPEADGAR